MESTETTSLSASSNTQEIEAEGKPGFSKRQCVLLAVFGLINFISAITFSIQAPFYPAEAEKKGATASEYGFVFGIFEFVIFLASPIYGLFMNKIGPKTLFCCGVLLNSFAVIAFGFLDNINDHYWFIGLSLCLRAIEGLGIAAIPTCILVYAASEFTSVATIFALLETCMGIGYIVGPTVGEVLFTVGGFTLPFLTIGVALLAGGLVALLLLPKTEKATGEDGEEQKGIGLFTILKIPQVSLTALSIVSTAASMGFVTATLEPHIRQFGLTPVQTGFMFVLNGGVYAFAAPLVGRICDKIEKPEYVTVFGNLILCISFLLIGPASFMPFETTLWVTIVGLALQGIGFGCGFVSTFVVGLKYCIANGLPDNVATYGVVSGMWQCFISLGAWVGPSVGGALYDAVGFREGSWFILGVCFIAGISILIHAWMQSGNEKFSESEPLLEKTKQPEQGQMKSKASYQTI